MLVSLKSVNQYVDIKDLSAEEIADKLTFAGVEVEEIKKLASGTNLVIGEVKECVAHPNSDHLHVLKVDLGPKYGVTQIVCGAPNARAGLRVIVARVGAVLPQIEIKQGVIRGEESNGMCCSLLELGVDGKYLSDYQKAGIEELPADAPVCLKISKRLGLTDLFKIIYDKFGNTVIVIAQYTYCPIFRIILGHFRKLEFDRDSVGNKRTKSCDIFLHGFTYIHTIRS